MENLNAEQIKKALECCTYGGGITKSQVEVCSPCPYFYEGNCTDVLKENALALITSQEQRIKELTEEKSKAFEKGAEILGRLEEAYLKLEAENLKLTEENERLHASCTELTRVQEENERLRSRYIDGIMAEGKRTNEIPLAKVIVKKGE